MFVIVGNCCFSQGSRWCCGSEHLMPRLRAHCIFGSPRECVSAEEQLDSYTQKINPAIARPLTSHTRLSLLSASSILFSGAHGSVNKQILAWTGANRLISGNFRHRFTPFGVSDPPQRNNKTSHILSAILPLPKGRSFHSLPWLPFWTRHTAWFIRTTLLTRLPFKTSAQP